MAFDPISAGLSLVDTVVKRIWKDPTEAEAAKLEALKVAMASEMAIHATNQAEAAHPSIFVAGWRPAVGWICAFGLAYAFILQPLLAWFAAIVTVPVPPVLDVEQLIALLVGMLGFGAYRTYEGVNNAKRSGFRWPWDKKPAPDPVDG